MKNLTPDKAVHNLATLIKSDLNTEVKLAAQTVFTAGHSFEQFFTVVGLFSVPPNFSKDLDSELWYMTKNRNETILKLSQHLRDSLRMFAG